MSSKQPATVLVARETPQFNMENNIHTSSQADDPSASSSISPDWEMQGTYDESKGTDEPDVEYVTGWRLHFLTLGMWISLFLSTLETTIVSTSLVSITDALQGFDVRDWVVTSYLLTYTGFLVIYAKLSDIFGRKSAKLVALFLFTLFSILCGVSNGMVELIILRAFQGMGASGIYSMVMVIAPTLVPPEKFGKYIAIVSSVFAIASVLGPVLGGVINTHSSWRWIFLLNAPGGALAIILIALFLPSSSRDVKMKERLRTKFSKASLTRIDIAGVVLLLTSSVLLVFALEEGGNRYAWSSGVIIGTLTIACVGWVLFVVWEFVVGRYASKQEAIFPLRLLNNRIMIGLMTTAFFTGFPFVSIVVNIPQRSQAVNGLSPVHAGLALLPLLLTSPFATALSGFFTSTLKIPPVYLIIAGAVLQVIGVGLTSSLPTNTTKTSPQQYGYEVIMGIGFGLGLSTILTMAPLVVGKKDLAVTMGALTQVRVLGGTIGLALCATVLNNHVRTTLSTLLTPSQLLAISDSLSAIESLAPEQRSAVREVFAQGYDRQMQIMTAFSGVAFLCSLLVWERVPRRVK